MFTKTKSEFARGSSTVVEYSPHHLKVKGLTPAPGRERRNGGKSLKVTYPVPATFLQDK
jgi:hypothetical protein